MLSALTRNQSIDYLRHRLRLAGGQPDQVMTDGAIHTLARAGNGLPRRLNVLGDNALLAGFSRGLARVDRRCAREAIAAVDALGGTAPKPLGAMTYVLTALALLLRIGALVWAAAPGICDGSPTAIVSPACEAYARLAAAP